MPGPASRADQAAAVVAQITQHPATPMALRVGDQVLLGSVQHLHLPGQHDQRSHGNRVGKKGLVPSKTGLGRYAHLERKGTTNAHVGDVVRIVPNGDENLAEALRGKEGTVTRWVKDNRAEIEFTDGETTDVHKDFLDVVRTSQEIAEDAAKGSDRTGNAKTILKAHYGDRLQVIGKETERTRHYLSELAKVPHSHHKAVAAHLEGSPTGGIYIGHAPVTELAPSMKAIAGAQPRGWGKGSTYSQVGGVYMPGHREIGIGVARDGSHSVATHELGHALDATLTAEQHTEWASLYKAIDSAVITTSYFHPLHNPDGHVSETFAELYSVWSTGGNVETALRAIGEARYRSAAGARRALTAVQKAFTFFEGIKP